MGCVWKSHRGANITPKTGLGLWFAGPLQHSLICFWWKSETLITIWDGTSPCPPQGCELGRCKRREESLVVPTLGHLLRAANCSFNPFRVTEEQYFYDVNKVQNETPEDTLWDQLIMVNALISNTHHPELYLQHLQVTLFSKTANKVMEFQ